MRGRLVRFFKWLRARAEDPYGPDRIETPDEHAQHLHRGLREFCWPMR